MNTHADKRQENKSLSVANAVSQKQTSGESTFQFVDNRLEAIQMRNLQELANNHAQKNTFQFVDNRPGTVVQKNWQEGNNKRNIIQRAKKISVNEPVAQLLMTSAAFRNSTQTGLGASLGFESRPADVRAIETQVNAYHALPAPAIQADAHNRLQALHGIQTAIHTHFSVNGMHESGHRTGMLNLLDDVRAEHQNQIQQLVANGHAPWTPNRGVMPAADLAAMDNTWTHVTGAAAGGSLAINDVSPSVIDGNNAAVPGFRNEMLAHIARLLTTDSGRRLITGLDAGPHAVTISPTYRGLTHAVAQEQVKAYGAETPGQDQEVAGPGGALAPGAGSISVVRMAPGSTDLETVDFNAAKEPILSPAYLGLGHELIHAMHNQRGVAWAANTHNPGEYAAGGVRDHYHNPEEFHTIAYNAPLAGGVVPVEHITENMIRAESQLPAREGHTGGSFADVIG